MDGISLALLIDGENVAATQIDRIMDKARELGEPVTRCVVGDFAGNRLAEWARVAPRHALELVFQRSGGKGSNSADIALTIHAMDLLARNAFHCFMIVSSDSDFTPLALRLARAGIAVFGMGRAKPDSVWRAACKDFFDLGIAPNAAPKTDAVPRQETVKPAAAKPRSPAAAPIPSRQDVEAVRDILAEATTADEPWLPLPILGQLIRRGSAELGARFCGKGKLRKNLMADPLVEVRRRDLSVEARLRERPRRTQSRPALSLVASASDGRA